MYLFILAWTYMCLWENDNNKKKNLLKISMDILGLNVMVSYQIQWHFCDGMYPWVNIANTGRALMALISNLCDLHLLT